MAVPMEEEYRFDDFDEGVTQREVSEVQLEKFQKFVTEYETQLRDIEDALEESLSEVWDVQTDPISLDLSSLEQATLFDLVKTDNKVFNKIVQTFSALMLEIDLLEKEAKEKLYPVFSTFGELDDIHEIIDSDSPPPEKEGDVQKAISDVMDPFNELSNFISRSYDVCRNLVRQFASLYHSKQKLYQQSFKGVTLEAPLRSLSKLFGVLITLDEIIAQNFALNEAWTMYKRMMKTIKLEPNRYNCSEDQLRQLEKFVLLIESKVLYGRIFQNCVEQEFDFEGHVEVRNNKILQDQIHDAYTRLAGQIAAPIETKKELFERYEYVGLCGLYALYHHVWRDNADRKGFKTLWDIQKRLPVVHLFGQAAWIPSDWLSKRMPTLIKAANIQDSDALRREMLKSLDNSFGKEVQDIYLQVCTWMVRMESDMSSRLEMKQVLSTRLSLFVQGLHLAAQVNNLIRTYLFMHFSLEVPFKSSLLYFIRLGIETLKAIKFTFHRRSALIAENLSYLIQQVQITLQGIFVPMHKRLLASRKYSDAKLDVLSAVVVIVQMFEGCATAERRTVLKLCLNVVQQMSLLKGYEWGELMASIRRLDMLCEMQSILETATDTSYTFFCRDLIPSFFEGIYKNPSQAKRLPYTMAALRDPFRIISKNPVVSEAYSKLVLDDLNKSIIDPLARHIETDLRLHIHSHLRVSDRNPLNSETAGDIVQLLRLRPLRWYSTLIDITARIQYHLEAQFYNLTALAPHDWNTYEEMRNLAFEKYDLKLTDGHLPGAIVDQGLDVLEIMRNIHIFVMKYDYNLNNQLFVEHHTDGKYINSIGIRHIANSIRTHGTGIMNTTVNFTYQFLRKKFATFSEFLFDDHVMSRLLKDVKWFKESKAKLNNQYPYDRAVKFNKEIRKLGMPGGLSHLDHFRVLISEMGNAIGYVRMVRAGGLHHVANAIRFIPDLKDIVSLEPLASKVGLTPDSICSARNVDTVISNLVSNFAEGTDYLKMLVNVFSTAFRSVTNTHLKNFYIVLPPLTINFVEHMLIEKEKLTKKGRDGTFTDDGFAIGVAYILRLLDQETDFDMLHWFDSIRDRYLAEQQRIESQRGKGKEESQTVTLTLTKLKTYEREFELLKYSFSGSRIFFKDSD